MYSWLSSTNMNILIKWLCKRNINREKKYVAWLNRDSNNKDVEWRNKLFNQMENKISRSKLSVVQTLYLWLSWFELRHYHHFLMKESECSALDQSWFMHKIIVRNFRKCLLFLCLSCSNVIAFYKIAFGSIAWLTTMTHKPIFV